jgi:dihydroorotate dehydrogenase (NAD+) catalytic subunit
MNNVDLTVGFGGHQFINPLVLASGILGTEARLMQRVALAGAGAITSKSCCFEPRAGYENPTVLAWENGLINAVGLTNPGVDKEISELKILRKILPGKVWIIASIFGATINEITLVAKKITEAKPDFIELNISCPHVDPTVKGAFYNNAEACQRLVRAVKKVTDIPIIVKLSPNVSDIGAIAQAAEAGGAEAISAINTLGPGMIIDIETGKPVLHNKIGGLSGPAIKPISVRCIFDIYKAVKIPIIGMGGVTNGRDAIEMVMAGATVVGIGSAIYYRGISVFTKILNEMQEFMADHKIKSLNEIRGIAHA